MNFPLMNYWMLRKISINVKIAKNKIWKVNIFIKNLIFKKENKIIV
jgi:hypothetical protein